MLAVYHTVCFEYTVPMHCAWLPPHLQTPKLLANDDMPLTQGTARMLVPRHLEELRLHIQLAELRYAARKLQICLHAFQYSHVREADLSNEFQLRVLRQCWNGLGDLEHGADDVVR